MLDCSPLKNPAHGALSAVNGCPAKKGAWIGIVVVDIRYPVPSTNSRYAATSVTARGALPTLIALRVMKLPQLSSE